MARVTKINVGGTNYDIAHEGELKNSGFEVVTSLPTTGLFEGREVVYQGIKYVYKNGWRSQYNPVNFPMEVGLRSSTEALTNAATVIELTNFELSQIPELLNKSLFLSNNKNVVKQSERVYELIDNETGDITVVSGIVNPVLGQTLRYTAINPSGTLDNLHLHILKTNPTSNACCVYIPQNVRFEKAIYKIEYYIYTNVTGDGDYNNKANYEWKTVFEKELNQTPVLIYPLGGTVYWTQEYTYTYVYNVRVSVKPTTKIHQYDIDIENIDILYYGGLSHKTPAYANRLINFDAVIEPTQTSTEFKSPLWLWQYLTQGVNWLKANKVALSVYNAKIAALEQTDSDNNAYTQSVKTDLSAAIEELSNSLATVATSGSYNDLTDKPKLYEANLLWGGRNIAAGFSPIDAGMMSELSANVMAFPIPAGISVEYSRDGGVTWLDYGATDEQKVNIFTSGYGLFCGKSYTDGLPATVGFQLRITITPITCGLYTLLNKIIMHSTSNGATNCWCTFKGLKSKYVAAGNEDDTYYDTIVNKAKITGWPGYNVLNFNNIQTANSTTDTTHANLYYRLRLIFGYDVVDGSSYPGLTINSLRFFGDGRYALPSNLAYNNHLYTYDWQQNAYFPGKVQSKELINFDVNNIEPTQTGSSVTKTSTWLWQYLVQAVNWLKANDVRLSAYNTKIAALEQADTDNNASIQSVSTDLTELSNGLATVATSGSYNDLTDTPTLAPVATSGDYNDLLNRPTFSGSYNDLTDTPNLATVATSGSYDDLLNTPALVFSNIGGTISSVQIPDGLIANTKLANSSMTLNGTTVNLGDTAILPWYVDYNETDYPARIRDHWLQIYRNGVWANLYYLLSSLPTECRYITDLSDPSWYDESVSEYELDNSATTQLLLANSSVNIANWIKEINANQITFNSSVIASKDKGALDNIISNLKGNGYSVFVENDIDTILSSGNDWVISIKIKRFNDTYKAIIECYVAR